MRWQSMKFTRPAITDVFTESEILLLCEAMAKLKEIKADALRVARDVGLKAGGRDFEERDFGMPELDRLMDRLNAE